MSVDDLPSPVEDSVDQGPTVKSHYQGLAHAAVTEDGMLKVEAHIVITVAWYLSKVGTLSMFAHDAVNVVSEQRAKPVNVAIFPSSLHDIDIRVGAGDNALNVGPPSTLEEVWVAGQLHELSGYPAGKKVGAVPHGRTARGVGTVLPHRYMA